MYLFINLMLRRAHFARHKETALFWNIYVKSFFFKSLIKVKYIFLKKVSKYSTVKFTTPLTFYELTDFGPFVNFKMSQ